MNYERQDLVVPPGARDGANSVATHVPREQAIPSRDGGSGLSSSEILRIAAKWRWMIAGIVGAFLLLGLVSTLLTPKRYRATAQVELSLQQIDITGSDKQTNDLSVVRDPQFVGTQLGLLRSRDLAERVARNIDSGTRAKLMHGAGTPAAQIDGAARAVGGGLSIDAVPLSRLINITYSSDDPGVASSVANAVADNYIASSLERKFEASAYARQFLERRIIQTKTALEQSERALVAYADQKKIILVGGDGEQGSTSAAGGQSLDSANLSTLSEGLSAAENDRIAAEAKYRNAGASSSQSQAITNPAVSALKSERAKVAVEYQDKLQTFKPDYPDMVALRARLAELDRQIGSASGEIAGSVNNAFRGEYMAALSREQKLRTQVEKAKAGVMDLRGRQIQYNILAREVDTNRTLYNGLLQRFKEVSVAGGVGSSQISIVDRATTPGGPYSPNLRNNLLIALMLGLLAGVGLAFAIEYIDDTIKNPDDVRTRLHLTLLGVVPIAAKGTTMQEALADPQSVQSEAYLSIRTAITFTTTGGAPRSVVVTSSKAAEGKSSSCFAIARSFARLGQSVLLIDGDMRKPTFKTTEQLGQRGLSSLLASSGNVSDHLTATDVENLFLMPSGPIPPNPVELLSGTRMRQVLKEAEGLFDIVVVDSPPVMDLADAPLLASICDVTIFVVQAGKVRRQAALRALTRLEQAGARVVGGIMTHFNQKRAGYGYGYGYAYGYGKGPDALPSARESRRQISIAEQ